MDASGISKGPAMVQMVGIYVQRVYYDYDRRLILGPVYLSSRAVLNRKPAALQANGLDQNSGGNLNQDAPRNSRMTSEDAGRKSYDMV
ncbi:hypothetical protein PspLS_10483 [Pyricularia sp. CBS 133598]|nr:hypothetical protein PspLS_10483 [Pyricularia sp. CBS 133598]